MTSLRRFRCEDMFRFGNINMDVLTETYHVGFYMSYLARWPECFSVAFDGGARLMGYIMGKAEGTGELWHGHVTAVTVAPQYRRLGLARRLMTLLEDVSEGIYRAYFVDLFVRKSNSVAIRMYEGFGYTTYREVLGYYSGTENAFDMRKALSRDREKRSMKPLGRAVHPHELEEWS